ncbi:hypothetical protein IFJ82_09770 [Novacetimonas hansenii]|uniref:hypothetical protein n=1 Tax=Novacetimonas hansenii TaxID=436 RepID=UPI00177F264F|nr:hypothetical protein [Novacetimonas hansenii]QOF94238.1 hypothetical protein IFJ82_09770 [Novacetimonas hansenii]
MKNKLIIVIAILLIIIIFLVSFILPSTITSDIGDHATWSASILSFFTAITTVVIGFYAYKISKEQNKSSQISYMSEILRSLSDQCNEAIKLAHKKTIEPDEAEKYPNIEKCLSNISTAIVKAKEIIKHLHPNDLDLYKNMFYSMIDSSVSTEIMEKNILNASQIPLIATISKQYDDIRFMVEPPTGK